MYGDLVSRWCQGNADLELQHLVCCGGDKSEVTVTQYHLLPLDGEGVM